MIFNVGVWQLTFDVGVNIWHLTSCLTSIFDVWRWCLKFDTHHFLYPNLLIFHDPSTVFSIFSRLTFTPLFPLISLASLISLFYTLNLVFFFTNNLDVIKLSWKAFFSYISWTVPIAYYNLNPLLSLSSFSTIIVWILIH